MHADALVWFDRKTWQHPSWTVDDLLALKGSRTISVVLPALNEEKTVGDVVRSIAPLHGTLVDELIVMDSGSTDATTREATRAGAQVVGRGDVVTHLAPLPGKGEVLWRSLAAATGDLVVFIDSDLVEPSPELVPGLLGPLLEHREVQLVKAFYRRPLRISDSDTGHGGGRVTELLARPALGALWPELAGVVQPLGGEYAATRSFLEKAAFPVGYGVEIGLLIDAFRSYGLDGIAQVNLGVRKHRNRDLSELGRMSRQILETILEKAGTRSQSGSFTQFVQVAEEWVPNTVDVELAVRPPIREVIGA
ncbi:glucosyl-3-phosphoglycerate synthase [Amycolatopsis pithecellobii]|uniref:Glucosyl-3-phosphoglycerate synthase n=1 Tax=Amycolatopsis pithecellobii TaxID=664692 RepID=A0A6N7Z009_9PSEU|nr:glucosyl-3-phosphoglycerate synthase [Amycolatopsis pithecellobii]MTD52724.1 glucosyl-3-phosphoglycerate synthase [Amycolatopsis pithecellobii]